MPILLLEGPRTWAELELAGLLTEGEEHVRLHPEAVKPGEFTSEVMSQGFFASAKTVSMLEWAEAPKWFAEEWLAAQPVADSVRAAIRVATGETKKLPKLKAAHGEVVKRSITERSPAQLIRDLTSRFGVTLADPARAVLTSVVLEQYDAVLELCEKAATAHPGSQIDLAAMAASGLFASEASVFDLMDALAAGRWPDVIKRYEIVAAETDGELPAVIGGVSYVVRSWIKKKRFPPARLREVHAMLVELDRRAKSSPMGGDLLLYEFLTQSMRILHAH